jgi:hypothetical protein
MEATEIPIDERVPGLGVVSRPIGQPEMPFRVLVPRMRRQERILIGGAGLNVSPIAS